VTGEPGQQQDTPQVRPAWQKDSDGEVRDLSGHFWATVRSRCADGRTVWSWMIIGYENQVLAAGQTGEQSAAKRLVEEWNRWVRGDDAVLDSTGNPPAITEDCRTYKPIWPQGR
jgi:hypothetical protein